MARRAIMVDVDGVLVVHPDAGGWSANLERDLGLPAEMLQQHFFTTHWEDVITGRATLRERLAPVLAEIAPALSCARLIDYWFSNDAHIDQRLLAEVRLLRGDGCEVHLATVQEHERAAYLWDRLDLCSDFDGIHYAAALGCSKPDPAFYRAVEAAVGLAPASIFFIDDRADNIAAARDCGWTAALWTGRQTLRALIDEQRWRAR